MEISLTAGMRSTLLFIQETDSATRRTVERLSSGKKVNSALDNPTSFFASSALRNAAADIKQLQDAIGEGVTIIHAATKGLEAVSGVLETMKGLVDEAAATSDPVTTAALAKSFDESYAQLNSIVNDAGYGGSNLISNKSADPLAVLSDDLTIALNAAGTADYQVRGRFMGAGYVLREAGGGRAWVPDERGEIITGYGTSGGAVGNVSKIELIVRCNPQHDTRGDINGDGVVEAGEGTEIDFRLTNTTGAAATGISFNNATTSTAWSFVANTGASLGNVPAGSSVRTDMATDLDLNFRPGSNGRQFTISMNVTSDGETRLVTFGPMTVGSMTNGQTFEGAATAAPNQTVTTQAVQITSADYLSGTFAANIPGVGAKVLQAEKQGLQLMHSWAYDGFRTSAGIGAARSDLAHALNAVRSYAKEIGASSTILTVRSEFNATLAGTYVTGADNLTLADMNEESANALMLQTRRQLSVTALAITGEQSKDVLKFLE